MKRVLKARKALKIPIYASQVSHEKGVESNFLFAISVGMDGMVSHEKGVESLDDGDGWQGFTAKVSHEKGVERTWVKENYISMY